MPFVHNSGLKIPCFEPHSSNIYKDIPPGIQARSGGAYQLRYWTVPARSQTQGSVCNAFQHIWGYFKKQASLDERKTRRFTDRYRFGLRFPKEDLIAKTRELLERYPNSYLQHSTLLKGDPMRLWHEALILTTSPSSALGQQNVVSNG